WENRTDKSFSSRRGGGLSRFRRIPPGREARSLCLSSKQRSDRLYNKVNGLRNASAQKANAYFIIVKNRRNYIMCGIVGYIGEKDSKEILLKGLERLEYRGCDSAGIAVRGGEGVTAFKEKGRIADLRSAVDGDVTGNTGIGHTRWATHGKPSRVNAHPHQNTSDRFTLVHNGVIENYHHLQRDYLAGVEMESDTDTEIIV